MEHGGRLKGIAAAFSYVKELGVVAAALATIAEVPVNRIWLGAHNLAIGVGVYGSDEGEEVKISLEEGQSYCYSNSKKQLLRPSGPCSAAISFRGDEARIAFLLGPYGKAYAIYHGLRILKRREV